VLSAPSVLRVAVGRWGAPYYPSRRLSSYGAAVLKSERFATDTARLEAFSDGVMAVIITLMVLDLKPPEQPTFASLAGDGPTFLVYALSFVNVGIYWNNHHHLLRASRGIDGRAMWANLHLLFWLSLIPFTTLWLGAHPDDRAPVLVYGVDLLLCGVAYSLLQFALIRVNGIESAFTRALATDSKGLRSVVLYLVAVGLAFVQPYISEAIFVLVAISWLVPDPRLESLIATRDED
jgi:uncharacterized membrane protein